MSNGDFTPVALPSPVTTSPELISKAIAENRIISPEEGQIRMNIGYAMGAATLVGAIFNPLAFGPIGAGSMMSIGVWRSGK